MRLTRGTSLRHTRLWAERARPPPTLSSSKLSAAQLDWTVELALDESEDKVARKQAVHTLAVRGACPDEAVLPLLSSPEQGVQRVAFQHLAELHRVRPTVPSLFHEVVELINQSDDVG